MSKANFELKRNPIIEKKNDWKKYIPNNYRTVITITADLELAWGPRFSNKVSNPLESALFLANRERKNIPLILKLCENYEIPITWATVGHLFLKDCERENGIPHGNIPKIPKYRGKYWDFNKSDWFEDDPCTNLLKSPEWYAPDLIKQILDSKISHEIGCHTFSHIDCRNEVCSPNLFEAEILECKKVADQIGIILKSFVHPGHTIGNLEKLSELGFHSFQSDEKNILGFPKRYDNGLWELKRTYEFVFRKEWSSDYHIYRYNKIIKRAIKSNAICNLWFHPSIDSSFINNILPSIFKNISDHKDEIYLTTVENYTSWLNNIHER